MAISMRRASECIGRKVTYPAAGDTGTIARVDTVTGKIYVQFRPADSEPEVVKAESLEWVRVLSDEEREWFEENIAPADSADEVASDSISTNLYAAVSDGGWIYVQLAPSVSPTGQYLDSFGISIDLVRTVFLDTRTDRDRMWEAEEAMGWKNP